MPQYRFSVAFSGGDEELGYCFPQNPKSFDEGYLTEEFSASSVEEAREIARGLLIELCQSYESTMQAIWDGEWFAHCLRFEPLEKVEEDVACLYLSPNHFSVEDILLGNFPEGEELFPGKTPRECLLEAKRLVTESRDEYEQ